LSSGALGPRFTEALRLRSREAIPKVLSEFNNDNDSVIAAPQQRSNEVLMLYGVRPKSEGKKYPSQD